MKEDKLSDLSMQLSVDVLKLTKELRAKHETVISNQIGRSATSVCANIAESKYGHSRADFIAKLEIALKEANETGKWLEMLLKSDYIDEATYIKDENGNPVKEWYAIASYLDNMEEKMDSRYKKPDGRKVVYASLNPVKLLRNANKFTYIAVALIILLIAIIVFVIFKISKRVKKKVTDFEK